MPAIYIVNSEQSKRLFHDVVDKNFDSGKYHKYTETSGLTRKLSQNALLHVWATEWAAFMKGISDKKLVPEKYVEWAKKTLKKHCYQQTAWEFLIDTEEDLITGEVKKKWKSSAKYERGEMFQFLEWFQALSAEMGLILESKGEFQELKQGDVSDS